MSSKAVAMMSGGVVLLLSSALVEEKMVIPELSSTWTSILWLMTSSIVAFGLLIWLVGKTLPTKVSYVSVLSPLVTVSVGLLLSLELPSLNLLLEAFIILSGSLVGIKSQIINVNYKKNNGLLTKKNKIIKIA